MDPIGNQFFCHGLFPPTPKRHPRASKKTGGDGGIRTLDTALDRITV
jgi:hypothetical protein